MEITDTAKISFIAQKHYTTRQHSSKLVLVLFDCLNRGETDGSSMTSANKAILSKRNFTGKLSANFIETNNIPDVDLNNSCEVPSVL